MEIKNIVHEHPLTLCENVNGGQLLCHGCGDPSFGESYSCNSCGFHPKTCSCCERQPSGHCSVYICEQCWPQSPLFHQSCLDLPEEIQITYRTGCSLKQSSDKSKEPYVCDYCNKKHKSFKYGCADCDFQIGIGCASKFIKYHQDQQHIEHFSHSHPLTLMMQLHDKMECMFCSKSINGGQGYGCAPCEFYIHSSCRDKFPEQIRRRSFHLRHRNTYLKIMTNEERGRRCDACCFHIEGLMYKCNDICSFSLHPECSISLKPQIKYSGHEHLLILVENSSYESKCKSCGFNIKGIFFMRCVECQLDFHVQCGPHPTLPPTVSHKEHQHPLILVTSSDSQLLSCKICSNEIKPDSSFYRCADANSKHDQYVAHASCAITQVDFDEKVNLKHFSHDEHVLSFREMDEDDHTHCRGCLKAIQGPAYGCDYCHFFLHKSCVELPRCIRLQSHSHYLTLQAFDTSTKSSTCDDCNKNFDGFMYNCRRCNLKLDLDCVLRHPLKNLNPEDGKRIEHFVHAHPMITLEVAGPNCKICCKKIDGQCWGCDECEFHIHTTCAELPKDIQHPFHPWHSLTLSDAEKYSLYSCEACDSHVQGFIYRCNSCAFHLHPECRSLPTVEYSGHDHLLILIENKTYIGVCEACGFDIWYTFFLRCVACCLDFHVQCGLDTDLPTTILHQQHEHPFALIWGDSDQIFCVVCKGRIKPNFPSYCCAECDCYAHARCVITKVQIAEREKIQHFLHPHKLLIFENKRIVDIVCSACENKITSDGHLTYGCDPCGFYLHKSCANLPRDLQHPFHRHTLSLSRSFESYRFPHRCDACHKRLKIFRYGCEDCDFNLDLKCSSLLPSIKNESVHEHSLTFINKLHGSPKCDYCQSLIQPNELTPLDDRFIRCLKCDFNLHLMCCPLPKTITHPCHLHSLSLLDKCAQLFNRCFEDEYYCDYCETIRSSQECVYYCDRCNYVVDLDCVLLEVKHFLEGKHTDVQPKHVRDRRRNNSYKDIIDTLTRDERKMMEDTLANFLQQLKRDVAKDRIEETKEKKKGTQVDIFKELKEIDERILDLLPAVVKGLLEKEAKEHVQEILQPDYIAEAATAELVNLGDYKIIPELAPVLEKMLDKHKDIGDYCGLLTPHLKTITLVILCGIMQSMKTTKVCNIDGESIIIWWFLLKFIENIGFKIDFALDHLKRVAADYFLIIKDDEIENRPLYKIQEKIVELYEEIDNLKKQTQEIISGRSTQRSRNEATRLNEALGRWWKSVAAGLLDDI